MTGWAFGGAWTSTAPNPPPMTTQVAAYIGSGGTFQSDDLVTLFDTMLYSSEFPEGFRAAAELRGFRMGVGRQPMSDTQQRDLSALRNTLQCLLAEHGLTSEPLGGCPLKPDEKFDSKEVGAIVQNVLAELKRRGLGS